MDSSLPLSKSRSLPVVTRPLRGNERRKGEKSTVSIVWADGIFEPALEQFGLDSRLPPKNWILYDLAMTTRVGVWQSLHACYSALVFLHSCPVRLRSWPEMRAHNANNKKTMYYSKHGT